MTGYTKKTFGKTQQKAFRLALANSLSLDISELTITLIKDGKAPNSVSIGFKVMVVQETLINEVVARMKDPQFDGSLANNLKQQNLSVNGDSLSVNTVAMKKVITKGLIFGLGRILIDYHWTDLYD